MLAFFSTGSRCLFLSGVVVLLAMGSAGCSTDSEAPKSSEGLEQAAGAVEKMKPAMRQWNTTAEKWVELVQKEGKTKTEFQEASARLMKTLNRDSTIITAKAATISNAGLNGWFTKLADQYRDELEQMAEVNAAVVGSDSSALEAQLASLRRVASERSEIVAGLLREYPDIADATGNSFQNP